MKGRSRLLDDDGGALPEPTTLFDDYSGRTSSARRPFAVDITTAARPSANVAALRADHTKTTAPAQGGILRPALLLEKPQ